MLPPKSKNRIITQAKSKQLRARNMEKYYAMVVDCMDISGLCVHTRVRPTRLKPSIKRLPPRWERK